MDMENTDRTRDFQGLMRSVRRAPGQESGMNMGGGDQLNRQ
jgi:hypothetical protein